MGEPRHAAALPPRPTSIALGISLTCLAFFLFSALDTTAKYLGESLPVVQIVWFRFASHVVMAAILFRLWKRPHLIRTRRPGLQLLRGCFMLGATVFNFLALRHLQLTEANAIMFATPLTVVILAGPMLGEWAGRHRWAAVIIGFLGVLVVTRPGVGGMHWAAFLSAAAMLCFALYTVTTRMLTATDTIEGLLLISAVVPTVVIAVPAFAVWEAPESPAIWGLLLMTGVFGGLGHFLLTKAYAVAPAPTLAPFSYTQIVWMTILGYLVFSDVPGIYTLIGMAIVVGSGLYVLYRERRRGTAPGEL
ncbi:RarD protein [Rhodobium orientis]|uniref:EamA family transporter n=1 Tax=Rhodobium orientis TaxID=34017 RepID=A0A327JHI8_9HYPH|nr:DMT family transporter [Rhodobium orientis]MBB4304447.1 RarD protein [Rhodobium orientis]MBK5949972.1 EamA family transporter [Rhodobium orientis]RAI25595.1 EamA family transporter [Rhodobium orientis]